MELSVFALMLGLSSSLLVSCGETSSEMSFEGTYEVISHTRNSDGCDTEGDTFQGDSYFRLERADGGDRLAYFPCDGPDSCEDIANATKSFDARDGDVWSATLWVGNESGSMCELKQTERVLTTAQNGVRIERRVYAKTYSDDNVTCDGETAESRSDELECQSYERVIAVSVGEQ